MKNKLALLGKIILLTMGLSLLLTACASAASAIQPAATGEAAQVPAGTPVPGQGERTQPAAMKLALGIVSLDDTQTPITTEQAQELLPLWKAVRSLSKSETSSSQEVDALIKQMQGVLTAEQTQAIDEMQLSFEEMAAVYEKLGIEMAVGGPRGTPDPAIQATMQAARESGEMPGGGGFGGGDPGMMPGGGVPGGEPGMGGGFGGGAGIEARQTAAASGGEVQRDFGLGISSELLDALIAFLQAKVAV